MRHRHAGSFNVWFTVLVSLRWSNFWTDGKNVPQGLVSDELMLNCLLGLELLLWLNWSHPVSSVDGKDSKMSFIAHSSSTQGRPVVRETVWRPFDPLLLGSLLEPNSFLEDRPSWTRNNVHKSLPGLLRAHRIAWCWNKDPKEVPAEQIALVCWIWKCDAISKEKNDSKRARANR